MTIWSSAGASIGAERPRSTLPVAIHRGQIEADAEAGRGRHGDHTLGVDGEASLVSCQRKGDWLVEYSAGSPSSAGPESPD